MPSVLTSLKVITCKLTAANFSWNIYTTEATWAISKVKLLTCVSLCCMMVHSRAHWAHANELCVCVHACVSVRARVCVFLPQSDCSDEWVSPVTPADACLGTVHTHTDTHRGTQRHTHSAEFLTAHRHFIVYEYETGMEAVGWRARVRGLQKKNRKTTKRIISFSQTLHPLTLHSSWIPEIPTLTSGSSNQPTFHCDETKN